jgi:hypothetical protein
VHRQDDIWQFQSRGGCWEPRGVHLELRENLVDCGDLFAALGSEEGIVRAVRVLGWIILTMGILTILFIPELYDTDAAEEMPWVIGVGVAGMLAGFLIVWFTSMPRR